MKNENQEIMQRATIKKGWSTVACVEANITMGEDLLEKAKSTIQKIL